MTATLHTGDCLLVMADLANDSIDAIVTDPPYGLGFMGKDWDKGVPGVEFWQQMLRVAKPGAYLLAFGGTRTSHRMACAIEDAGWEIRDTIMWLYGSGFPKSHNLGDGRGTALKPAFEPIIMARKPLVGTVAANVLAYGTGALNIDLCRVETDENLGGGAYTVAGNRSVSPSLSPTGMNRPGAKANWPARNGNHHPTVKPTPLMRYLVRLVTPRGGTFLDPFAGSGSTGKAAVLEWVNFIGIELEAEYAAIAERRIAHAEATLTSGATA